MAVRLNRILSAFMALLMVTPGLLSPARVAADEPASQYSVTPVSGVAVPGVPSTRPGLADPAAIQLAPYLSPIARGPQGAPPAGQTIIEDPSGGASPGPQAPSVVTGFDGMDNTTNISVAGVSLEPPDPMIAAGPDHVVQTQNLTVRISTKAGVTVSTFALAGFLLVPAAINRLADPKIVFDPVSERFFLVVVGYSSGANQGMEFIAVSTASDPTQSWTIYQFTDTGYFPDFPGLAVGGDKVVVTANAYALPGPGAFQGAQIRVLEKADMVSGLGASGYLYAPNPSYFTRQPAQPFTASATVYLASLEPAFLSTTLNIFALTGSVAGQTLAISSTALSISGASIPPDALQLGGGTVSTNDTRLLGAVWRNQRLHTFTNAACLLSGDTATRSCLKFFEVDTSGAIPALVEEWSFGAAGAYYYYPAMTFDGAGNKYVVFTRSSSSEYASVWHTGQLAGVSGLQGSALLKAGQANYSGTRWGDYHAAAPDPAAPGCVWVTGEYAKSSGAGGWGTYSGQLTFGNACTGAPAQATQLAFSIQPGGAAPGAPLAPQPAVAVKDASGATVTTASNPVTLSIAAGPAGAVLTCAPATNTVNAVNGVASFAGCSLNLAGTYTLRAASPSLAPASSNPITVLSGPVVPVKISPASAFVAPGGTKAVNLVAELPAGTALGSWGFDINYDIPVVNATACAIDLPAAEVRICDSTGAPGRVRVGGASLGGLTGTVTLASITFTAVGAVHASSLLDLVVSGRFLDTHEAAIALTTGSGFIAIGDRCDLNGDGLINSTDALRALRIWVGQIAGDGDVNGDGATDSADALRILRVWANQVNCDGTPRQSARLVAGSGAAPDGSMPAAAYSLATVTGAAVALTAAAPSIAPGGAGAAIDLTATIPAGQALGGWSVDITYDASLVTPTACTINLPGADVRVCDRTSTPQTVKVGGASLDGLTGTVTLATITFASAGTATGVSALNVLVTSFVNTSEAALPVTASGGISTAGPPAWCENSPLGVPQDCAGPHP